MPPIIVSGDAGAMLHWNGQAMTALPTGLPPHWYVTGVAALASNDVWWWGDRSSATSAYLHWDGAALAATPVDTLAVGGFLYSGAIIDGRWWLVGREGSIYTKSGLDTVSPIIAGHTITILDMWGAADDDMYFASGGEISQWNGATMQTIPIEANTVTGVRAGGADELFATGVERTADLTEWITNGFHFDGTRWTKTACGDNVHGAPAPVDGPPAPVDGAPAPSTARRPIPGSAATASRRAPSCATARICAA